MRNGSAFSGPALVPGALLPDAATQAGVPVRVPLGMPDRQDLMTGATRTGRTKTLQLLAGRVPAHGVPALAADVKGQLSGLALVGDAGEEVGERTR